MSHIHTNENQHDFTVSMIIFLLQHPNPKVLLHLHKKYNKYMQFGGHIELDETPWQAVAHELIEETGYELEQMKIVQPSHASIKSMPGAIIHPLPIYINTHLAGDEHYHTDQVFMLTTDQEPRHQIDQSESQEFIALNYDEFKAFDSNKMADNCQEAIDFCFKILRDNKTWTQVSCNEFSLEK